MKKIVKGNKVRLKKERIKVKDLDDKTWYTIKWENYGENKVKGIKHSYDLVEVPYTITRKDIKEMKSKHETI